MEKRYQVFVSSTFEDLREERQKTIEAVLSCDCIPIGMEYFAAGDETQWALIKRFIAECDYYMVIVAGRYGSVDADGKSYTQKEYEFAVEKDIPVMAFLHGEPGKIPNEKSETSADGKVKLEEFRNHCKKRICKDWTSPDGLAGQVAIALNQAKKTHPRTGWVRADQVPDESAPKDILKLKSRIEQLEREREELSVTAPVGAESLQQGEDSFELTFHTSGEERTGPDIDHYKYLEMDISVNRTWGAIFNVLAPTMISEAIEWSLATLIEGDITAIELEDTVESQFNYPISIENWKLTTDDFHTIKIQLRSLGLIAQSVKARSVKDTATYWKLTPYGDNVMTRMRALKREEPSAT